MGPRYLFLPLGVRAVRRDLALWLLGFCLLSPGCTLVGSAAKNLVIETRRCTDEYWEGVRERRLADEYLARTAMGCPDGQVSEDFASGFQDGFVDYLHNGGAGLPPPLPPERYRTVKYETPEGHAAIGEWFEGFRQGAAAAQASGLREFVTVPVALAPPPRVPPQPPPPPPDGVVPPGPTPAPVLPSPRKLESTPAQPGPQPRPAAFPEPTPPSRPAALPVPQVRGPASAEPASLPRVLGDPGRRLANRGPSSPGPGPAASGPHPGGPRGGRRAGKRGCRPRPHAHPRPGPAAKGPRGCARARGRARSDSGGGRRRRR